MKLQDQLPQGVTVDGKYYKCDFDFRNVLNMMEILGRSDMMPEARDYKALKCVMKRPKNVQKVLLAVRSTLFHGSPKGGSEHKITDFAQDAWMIRAAFRQSYGIDLYRAKLHWIEFSELLNSIPEGSRYTEVLGIRARPIPTPTKYNHAEREWLIKAKAGVALTVSEEEQKKQYEKDVGMVFEGLMSFIKGSE